MKKIFVTVAEFLDNGGILRHGRDIYAHQVGYAKIGTFEMIGDDLDLFYYKSNITGESTHRETKNRYVEIDCTPHYV